MKTAETIYDHVIRVWPPVGGDLRAGDVGVFGELWNSVALFRRDDAGLRPEQVGVITSSALPRTSTKDRWLSDVDVELHFAQCRTDTLPASVMEKLVAAQMRVIVKVDDQPHVMHTTFMMPSSGTRLVPAASLNGEARVAIQRGVQVDVVAQFDEELRGHLNGMVRSASGEWAPGDPEMLRIIRVSMTLEQSD